MTTEEKAMSRAERTLMNYDAVASRKTRRSYSPTQSASDVDTHTKTQAATSQSAPSADDASPAQGEDSSTDATQELENPSEVKDNESTTNSDQEVSGWEKRYGDLRRKADQDTRERDAKIKDLEDKLKEMSKAERVKDIPLTEKEINAYKEKHPESYKLMLSIAKQELLANSDMFDTRLKDVDQKIRQIEHKEAYAQILQAHPDVESIQNSTQFSDWFYKQTQATQALFSEGATAKDVINGFKLYKQELGIKRKSDTKREAAASVDAGKPTVDKVVDSNKPKQFRESEIRAMSEKEYLRNREEIKKAMASGNVILDISSH